MIDKPSESEQPHYPRNPFSASYLRPGVHEFLFPADKCMADLLGLLAQNSWRGQIVGPHGSGKSTLLLSLMDQCRAFERAPVLFALHDGQRRLGRNWTECADAVHANLIVVDGYEQLSYWSRFRLKRECRRRGWGLLVTAHHDVGLPTLFTTQPTLELAQVIVQRLLRGSSYTVDEKTIAECFATNQGNLREMLFALYDRCEPKHREMLKNLYGPSVRPSSN